ncbi:MAG: hypothetical protein ACTHMJ_16875 [Thermomicrobiales bacterium]|jgi:hypothetical protein|nr:hypothetical protein [Thermomicrobiales bacterium]
MRLFVGLSRTDYEEVLRAVGALIDERGWTNVTLLEVDEGIIVQAADKQSQREAKPRLETYLLTDSDLERVMREATMRRRKRAGSAVAQPATPVVAPDHGDLAALNADQSAPAARSLSPGGSLHPVREPVLPNHDRATVAGFQAPDEIPLAPLPDDISSSPFSPAPMKLASGPANTNLNADAARAAVVMAHIVAARLRSGVPMTGDDPDLLSLLDQVRALDETGIGQS